MIGKIFIKSFCGVMLWSLLLASCKTSYADKFNLGFETMDKSSNPVGWTLSSKHAVLKCDTKIKYEGKQSLSFVDSSTDDAQTTALNTIPACFSGNTLKLTGYIKTEGVERGGELYIMLRSNKGFDFNEENYRDMSGREIKGTTDWKKYSLEIPYDSATTQIIVGAALTGKGKMWVDNLQLSIDGVPIDKVPHRILSGAEKDTVFNSGSHIEQIELSPTRIHILTNLGMVWGFLKYHHPAIEIGKYNWDASLFRILPQILNATNEKDSYSIIEKWTDSLGVVPTCDTCRHFDPIKAKLMPDYGSLFKAGNLPESLIRKLERIRDNHHVGPDNYYISTAGIGNPHFNHEIGYEFGRRPDAGLRLLALYRYWNMIAYFYPDRHLIEGDWNKILPEFIPKFINANSKANYSMACLELVGRIHDSHAYVSAIGMGLDSVKGQNITPFHARFVEDKLVVTGYYTATQDIKEQIKIGDIIEAIDGIPVDALVKKYLSYTPGSNYVTQLRDLCSVNGFLLRSNRLKSDITVNRNGIKKILSVDRIPLAKANIDIDNIGPYIQSGYKIIGGNIGYIYPAKLKENDIGSIRQAFKNTRGLIIDMRCYPSTFMPYVYGCWLKNRRSAFVRFTYVSTAKPGLVEWGDTVANGADSGDHYNGKLVMIVNEQTQSQAEFTIMALQKVSGAITIGSNTAGADGDVSSIVLPGGIHTAISGLGILYPDGTETQRVGVRIDKVVKPTIKGIREGRDELLEEAIGIIQNKVSCKAQNLKGRS